MRRTTALLVVFNESRATDFERGSEAAGPAENKINDDANEHGGAGVRSSPRRTAR